MIAQIVSFIVLGLSAIHGLRMVADGIFNLATGGYIGGYDWWWYIVKSLDLSPNSWGLIFLLFGIIWLGACALYVFYKVPGRIIIMILSLLSLWYLLWGTVIAISIFILNFFAGNNNILETKTQVEPENHDIYE